MSTVQNDALKEAFETAVSRASFSMSQLFQALGAPASELIAPHSQLLQQTLGHRIARHVLHSLLRISFLVETVLDRGGATKMSVRWTPWLANDVRYAGFEECRRIFDYLLDQLRVVFHEDRYQSLLTGFSAYKLLAYELPIDYRRQLTDSPIHKVDNISWDWSPLPFRIVGLRQLLRAPSLNPYSAVFEAVYRKIAVKTYLTDRAQTGDYQTNREKRWESHPRGFQYALRRECWGVEGELINQVCRFADFPVDLFTLLERQEVLSPMATPYRCPITLDILSFREFQKEVLSPQHGRARFQVGHLNPLRALSSTASGHTAANIGWISADGNRIQGHLSLEETRALLRRIADNYKAAGLT